MQATGKSRRGAALAGVVMTAVFLGLALSFALPGTAFTPGVTVEALNAEDAQAVCPADVVEFGPDADLAPPDPACADCPRKVKGKQCTRLSCDPCCYACIGEPLPICG